MENHCYVKVLKKLEISEILKKIQGIWVSLQLVHLADLTCKVYRNAPANYSRPAQTWRRSHLAELQDIHVGVMWVAA